MLDYTKITFNELDDTDKPLQAFYNYDLKESEIDSFLEEYATIEEVPEGVSIQKVELCLTIYAQYDFKLEACCTDTNNEQYWVEINKQFINADEFIQMIPDYGVTNMNDTYFGNRIERSPLGNMGLQLLEAQEKLVSQEYEVENLRIKAAMYKAYFFRNSILAEKLEKQSEENRDALIGEFDGFSYASWRANAVYRTLEDMCYEGLLTEKEYRECKV